MNARFFSFLIIHKNERNFNIFCKKNCFFRKGGRDFLDKTDVRCYNENKIKRKDVTS